MSLSFHIGDYSAEIGSSAFLHAFFSTICYRLEGGKWGSKYPEFMKELYQGKLEANNAMETLQEVMEIREKLKTFSPKEIIWDIDNLQKRPPWGDKISPHITNLSNYFVTSDGKDLFEVLIACLQRLEGINFPLTIS